MLISMIPYQTYHPTSYLMPTCHTRFYLMLTGTSTTDKMRQLGCLNSDNHIHQSHSQMCSSSLMDITSSLVGAIKPFHWPQVIYCWPQTRHKIRVIKLYKPLHSVPSGIIWATSRGKPVFGFCGDSNRPAQLMRQTSVSSQCTRSKSSLAWKPEVRPKCFEWYKTFKKCYPPDFKFYLGKLNNKKNSLYGAMLILCLFSLH